jgi:hypothetical protein
MFGWWDEVFPNPILPVGSRAEVFLGYHTVLNYINTTRTKTGLHVDAHLIHADYPTGRMSPERRRLSYAQLRRRAGSPPLRELPLPLRRARRHAELRHVALALVRRRCGGARFRRSASDAGSVGTESHWIDSSMAR